MGRTRAVRDFSMPGDNDVSPLDRTDSPLLLNEANEGKRPRFGELTVPSVGGGWSWSSAWKTWL